MGVAREVVAVVVVVVIVCVVVDVAVVVDVVVVVEWCMRKFRTPTRREKDLDSNACPNFPQHIALPVCKFDEKLHV